MSRAYDLCLELGKKLTTEIGLLGNEIRLRGYKLDFNWYEVGSLSSSIGTISYLREFLETDEEYDEISILLMKLDNEWRFLLTNYCYN